MLALSDQLNGFQGLISQTSIEANRCIEVACGRDVHPQPLRRPAYIMEIITEII